MKKHKAPTVAAESDPSSPSVWLVTMATGGDAWCEGSVQTEAEVVQVMTDRWKETALSARRVRLTDMTPTMGR